MTDFAAPFELRRLNVKMTRAPIGTFNEDADVITFHFAKIVSGAISAAWVTGDFTAIENAFDTLWTTERSFMSTRTTLAEYRWYKDGPAFSPADRAAGGPNPSVRTTVRALAGTDSTSAMFPPQVALTVTEIVSIRKRWGRFYLIGGSTAGLDTDGRVKTTHIATRLGAFVTFYNACRAAGIKPVVFSRERSLYVTDGGVTIPAHVATAYEITDLQMDNIWDVMRSRRYSAPTVRTKTTLT